MNYFITGLPRSRTAWLSNFLSYGNSLCYHDIFRDYTVDDLPWLFAQAGVEHVGNSDPANLLYHRKLRELFPKANWVVVWRDEEDAARSAERAFGFPINLGPLIDMVGEVVEAGATLVNYDELDSELAMEIAHIVAPGFHSPECRNKILDHLNVQIDPTFMRQEIARLKGAELWA